MGTVAGLDGAELLLALHSGERDSPRWSSFLRGLSRLCVADSAALVFTPAGQRCEEGVIWRSDVSRRTDRDPPLFPSGANAMRPARIYALEELFVGPAERKPEPQARSEMRFGRLCRVGEPGGWNAWLAVFRRVGDLTALDSARLSALAPHLQVAMSNFAQLELARLAAAITEDLLARANVLWRTYAADGRVMFPGSSSSRWSLADSAFEEQTEAARLASSASKAAVVFRTRREQDALAIPLATGELAGPAPTGVTIVMRERRALSLTARVAEQIWSLTPSEARLAVALADGDSLSSAAVRLGVTLETARNYSKRIYAKMEASGQADVVRRVLTSVAPLAGAV